MMGERRVMQEALFYGFSLERHVPSDHLLRKIDRFVDLSEVRAHLEPYYSEVGRPSIDPELMIRMLIVGYCFGVRSERRLCEEAHLNLACRWFCRLGLDGEVPDHSTFSKNRHGRFREIDLLRKLFETVVARCMKERLVGGEAFAVDASMIVADAHRRRGVSKVEDLDPTSSRAVAEYLSVLDDAAFGGATPAEPKAISPTDPAARGGFGPIRYDGRGTLGRRSLGPSSIPSLGDSVMLGTAWIDRPVDTQGRAPCFHVLLSAAWKHGHALANDRHSSRVFAMAPRGFARTTRNG